MVYFNYGGQLLLGCSILGRIAWVGHLLLPAKMFGMRVKISTASSKNRRIQCGRDWIFVGLRIPLGGFVKISRDIDDLWIRIKCRPNLKPWEFQNPSQHGSVWSWMLGGLCQFWYRYYHLRFLAFTRTRAKLIFLRDQVIENGIVARGNRSNQ